ncbi:hypothetical protein [Sulfurimonas autotrophica]|uniref:Uncharacterized protein n=1 Tax=Sulfurimonas autotrophica (strain ATCC BAA-671 / DSM 16294 / JCM 11897 / OK10) TaxID=563040 RepID=E0UTV1_SULAO|nr:hypothetical protein [Sulfurimonas autotrophica]ADN09395.1 hypothetical protein Saut_1348 [Sulfurimonas autotrophica DSM 16294]
MDKRIEEVLHIWHTYFEDENNQYSEYEPSDIEYFVGCMLYNHFAFSKALDNLKTMDLSYDFLSACGDEYDDIKEIIAAINFEDEQKALKFLQNYIQEAKAKYTKSELYLLDRLEYHVNAMAQRYEKDVDVQRIDFENPLLRQ